MVNCSNRNCNYNIPTDYFINHYAYEKIQLYQNQINEYDKYEKILDSLIKRELFCITCCVKQCDIICSKCIIPKKNYSVGYIHKLDK
jgi:hypothetical protein